MVELIIPAASLVMVGALLAWLAHASDQQHLGRNGAVGIRTRATLRSDAAWAAGHRAAVPLTRLSAWASWLGAGTTIALLALDQVWAWMPLVAGYVAMFGLLMAATVQANRAARETVG